jgi:hypothetical protein
MSTVAMGASAAREVAPWVERLARIGYAAKGALYLTIGLLALLAGLRRSGGAVDTQGALRVVHHATFGRIALMVIAAGLLGYAAWRIVEAVVDPDGRGRDLKGLALRGSFAFRGVAHGALGITALRLAARERPGARTDQTPHWTARAFELPAGELLVWLAAIGIAGYGIYQLYRAYASKLSRQLSLVGVGPGTTRWVIGVSRFGIGARGVVFCLIGYFLARAAAAHNASEAGGVRKSLGVLADIGRWPFMVVALGLMAYGVYELVNARYRRISVV